MEAKPLLAPKRYREGGSAPFRWDSQQGRWRSACIPQSERHKVGLCLPRWESQDLPVSLSLRGTRGVCAFLTGMKEICLHSSIRARPATEDACACPGLSQMSHWRGEGPRRNYPPPNSSQRSWVNVLPISLLFITGVNFLECNPGISPILHFMGLISE